MAIVRKFLGALNPFRLIGWLLVTFANWRKVRFGKLDYVMLAVPPKMPALPEGRGWLRRRVMGQAPLSLLELDQTFKRIAADPRAKGVILYLRDFEMGIADIQTLRDSIVWLRGQGKRVVCYAHTYSFRMYYVASAANDIILQEGGELETLGIHIAPVFLKDALDAIGVEVDVVAISPYKSAGDILARNDISPEVRDMMNWLLDSNYEMVVQSIATSRHTSPEAVKAMIDGAPYLDEDARKAGFVDALLKEEGIPAYLEAKDLVPWEKAQKALIKPRRKRHGKYVAVLPVGGLIIEGESQKPPLEIPLPFVAEERMGSITVVQQVRQIMQDKSAAAVVLYIDSGGGSATASEAMHSALSELAKDRPLVVYMSNVAGSGGYYIATPAQWIVAQPGTITGSIGVINMKAVNDDMWKKLRVNTVELERGANVSMRSGMTHWTETQRQQVRASIERIYRQFVGHVSRSRKMTFEEVDAIGGGRVWTGTQGLQNGLVDELGGLNVAIKKAHELAGLPEYARAKIFHEKPKPLAPQLAEQANPAAALLYAQTGVEVVGSGRAQMLMPMVWK